MKTPLKLLLLPLWALTTGWVLSEADDLHMFQDMRSSQAQTELVQLAGEQLAEQLTEFREDRNLNSAFELLEHSLLLAGLRDRQDVPMACFWSGSIPPATDAAQRHTVLGSEELGYPVITIGRGEEPLYWRLDGLLESATDPWFEYDARELFDEVEALAERELRGERPL